MVVLLLAVIKLMFDPTGADTISHNILGVAFILPDELPVSVKSVCR